MNIIQKTRLSLRAVYMYLANIVRHPEALFELIAGLVYLRKWTESLRKGHNALADQQPWLTYRATRYLEQIVSSDSIVFEYGSGGSTLFFASRVKRLIAVEHEPDWQQNVEASLQHADYRNADVWLVTPEQSVTACDEYASPLSYCSSDERYRMWHFEKYCRVIDQFDDESFDLICVDGRARPACIRHSLSKVKPNGYLLLDNSDLAIYSQGITLLKGWNAQSFFGPVPYSQVFSRTTVWQKPG